MIPNAEEYNPDPQYMSDLIESSGKTQEELSELTGYNVRTIRSWIAPKGTSGARQFPYAAQFIMECLVLQV